MSEKNILNVGPLGLIGFGMTYTFLNLSNVGIINVSSILIASAVMLGGTAQLIAGLFCFRDNLTFGGTVFLLFALFWYSFAIITVHPFEEKFIPNEGALFFFFLAWTLTSFAMFVVSLQHNFLSKAVFGTLFTALAFQTLGLVTGNTSIGNIGNWVGVLCGVLALYSGLAQLVNGEYKRTIFPA